MHANGMGCRIFEKGYVPEKKKKEVPLENIYSSNHLKLLDGLPDLTLQEAKLRKGARPKAKKDITLDIQNMESQMALLRNKMGAKR